MANAHDDLERLHGVIADLAAPVYRLKQRPGTEPQSRSETPSTPLQSATVPPPPPAPLSAAVPLFPASQGPTFAAASKGGADELESTIGKLWLNRIGIF